MMYEDTDQRVVTPVMLGEDYDSPEEAQAAARMFATVLKLVGSSFDVYVRREVTVESEDPFVTNKRTWRVSARFALAPPLVKGAPRIVRINSATYVEKPWPYPSSES